MNAGEDVEKSTSYTTGRNANPYSHYREQYGDSLKKKKKKLGIKLPYDPAIPLLGIYPEKTIIQMDTCTPVFTVALFTVAKTWTQPRYSSRDEWIKKSWCIYTMEGMNLSQL